VSTVLSISGFDCTSGSRFGCSSGNGERRADRDDEQHAEDLCVDHLEVEIST